MWINSWMLFFTIRVSVWYSTSASEINSSLIKRLHRQSNNESTEEQPEKELSEASEVATNESDEISDLTEV